MTAWRWLRSGCALRQSDRKYSARRQHRLALEPLEERAMMSAEPLLPQGTYDAGAAFIAPAWFQQMSQPAAPGGDGILSTAPAIGTLQWQNTALSVYQNEWIVQLSREALAQVHSVAEVAGLFQAREFSFEVLGGLGATGQLLVRAAGASSDAVSAWLATDANVAYYEPNAILPLAQSANDPSYGLTWGLHNTGQNIGGQAGVADADIDAPEAWNLATGSSSIVVGIVDTGIDYTHPDLAANVWTNPGEVAGNGVDDDGNGFVDDIHGYNFVSNTGNAMDDNGHGTHVAGTIAAVGNNGSGVAGVNWNSSVMALKFLDANGSGSVANAVRALNYATLMRNNYGVNVRLTNNSWGGGGYSQSLYDAIAANGQAGILFVAAAGNSAQNNDATPSYPAGYNLDNVIAVAATDNRDALASFSSYGATTVDLAAPGVNIYSTQAGGGYRYMSGTSMATPHVSGVAALAWSLAPTASVAQIRGAILGGVDHIASLGGKVATGGRLNALGTLQLLGMNVAGSTPAAGGTTTVRPTQFTVDFSQNYDPASVQAGDFTVNGVAANTYTLVDANTIRFNYSASPVTAGGAQLMQIAQGAISQAGGAGVAAWQGSFYYDAVPMTVLATNPAQGATLTAPPQYLTLDFNEAVTEGSVGTDDLTLSSGSVTAAALLDADTVRYTVSIPRIEGAVTYTLQAGALTDAFGNPVAAYTGSFNIDDPSLFRYQATDTPRQIADGGLIYSYLTIGENRTITDADVELSITHTWDADLRVYLVAPDGTTVNLFTHVGGDGNNFTCTILDDAAGSAIVSGAAPFTGRYRPESPLAALNGKNTAGTWKLAVADDAAQDTGVLTGWALQFRANNAPTLASIADRTISHNQGSLTVNLSASDADGDALTYSAGVLAVDPLAQQAYNWSQQYRARYISNIDNLHRAGEKWLLAANGQLFALMANGDLRQWTGTIAGSPVVARFSAAYYADPTLLTNAPSPQSMLGPNDVTLTVQGNQLLIQPRAGATGTFLVHATVSDGLQTTCDTFRVSVTNVAPVLADVPNQTMSHRQESLIVNLSASDADGDTLTYSATVLPADPLAQQAYEWSQQHRARYISNIDNLHGAGEKWLLAANGQLFALMSNGDLRQWSGLIAGSPVVARFSTAYYADPNLLCNAQSPQAMLGPSTVTLTVQGSQLLIQPAAGATGSFDVRVGVSDGVQTVTDTFRVTVTNVAPVLADVPDQTISHSQGSLTVNLSASDADGDALTYSATVLPVDPLAQQAYEWSQRLQARYIGNIDNLHRAGEKWLLAGNGQLYFFLSNGELHQWTGTIAGSPTVARFSAAYYADPNLLCNAPSPDAMLGPSTVTLTLQGSQLLVQPAAGVTGSFEVRVAASDGAQTASDTFRVTVTNAAPVLVDVHDQTMSARQTSLTVNLSASDADGDTLTYTASVLPIDSLAQQAYEWSQRLQARYIDNIDNLHRAGEKWLLAGNGQLYFLLSNGELRQWTGTIAGSPTVARFSAAYYADPRLLANAQSPETMLGPGSVTLTVQGNQLVIRPRAGVTGSCQIRVTVGDGVQSVSDTFNLAVRNSAPVLTPVADQTIPAGQNGLTVNLSASDADGDTLSYTATILPADPLAQQAYTWSQQNHARYISNIDNLHGAQEKWLLAANGQLFALMPNGDLRQWTGTIAGSPVVARFSAAYYADPTLLANAQSPQTMLGPNDLTLTVQGSQLIIQPRAGATGNCQIRVSVTDGVQTVGDTFRLDVFSNAPPRVLQDAELDALFQTQIVDGSIDRGDMMQLLRSAGNDNGTVDATELTDLRYVLTNATAYHIPGYVQVLAGDVVNGNAANANFQGQALGNLAAGSSAWHINTLVDKWFLGADHPSTTYTYRTFAGSLFVGGPSYNDSDQGYLGDCYFIASMDAIAKSSPAAVQNMFIDNGDNTWTVRFYYNGTADYVTVDRALPTYGNYAVYADVRGTYTNSGNELWMALAEKAYAQWNETGKEGRDGRNSYPSIEGGWMQTVCQQVLGTASQTYWGLADAAKQTLIAAVNANKAVTYGTISSPGNGLVGPHAYMVSSYNASTDTFQLYNPWGSSHPGPLTYAQLRANGQCFVIADPSGSVPANASAAGGINENPSTGVYASSANAPTAGHHDRVFAAYDVLDGYAVPV